MAYGASSCGKLVSFRSNISKVSGYSDSTYPSYRKKYGVLRTWFMIHILIEQSNSGAHIGSAFIMP